MKAAPAPERSGAMRAVPFDLAAAEAMPGWRDGLAWPQSVAPVRREMEARYRALLERTAALEPNLRRAAILSLGRIVSSVSALLECALLVEAERTSGIAVQGGPAELDWLRGVGTTPPVTPQRIGQPQSATALPALRRLARTASWTPWWRLPGAVLAPEAEAVSHNTMLREAARDTRVRFVQGERLLDAARRGGAARGPDMRGVAETMTDVFTSGFDPAMARRLDAIAAPKIAGHLAAASDDLAALANARVPRHVWSGSAGGYAARALGLEAMRRGGEAVRFDHGGAAGMLDNPDSLTLRETSASSRFVAATEAIAEICRASDRARPIPGLAQAKIAGGAGEPHFRQAKSLPRAPGGPRPRAVYATGAVYGFRQIFPPVPRDTVYLDWQMRLAQMLLSLPADITLKPHPEGIFRGKVHPLTALGPSTPARFETVMAGADIFVFDFPLSTAFWTALCSDRPVVFVDLGLVSFHPQIRRMIGARCRVVTARWDENNLPVVEKGALEAAIFARGAPDPSPFGALLAGTA